MAEIIQVRSGMAPIQWGSVIAGVVCSGAAIVVLGLIGSAFGWTAASGSAPPGGVAIWGCLSAFAASVIGAYVTVRTSVAPDARLAMLEGMLVWCLGILAGALFIAATLFGDAFGAAALVADRSSVLRAHVVSAEVILVQSGFTGLAALFGLVGAGAGVVLGRGAGVSRFAGIRKRMPMGGMRLGAEVRREAERGDWPRVPPVPPGSDPMQH